MTEIELCLIRLVVLRTLGSKLTPSVMINTNCHNILPVNVDMFQVSLQCFTNFHLGESSWSLFLSGARQGDRGYILPASDTALWQILLEDKSLSFSKLPHNGHANIKICLRQGWTDTFNIDVSRIMLLQSIIIAVVEQMWWKPWVGPFVDFRKRRH